LAVESTLPQGDQVPKWLIKSIVLLVGTFGALIILWWLVRELRGLLIMILVSLFLSFAIEPAVNRLEKMGIRRGVGCGIVFLALFTLLGLFLWAIGTVLAEQLTDFIDEAPDLIEDAERWIEDTFDVDIDTNELLNEFQEGGSAADLATRLAGDLVSFGARILSILFQLLTIGLFTFYLVVDGPRLRRAICSLLEPARQEQVLSVWELAVDKTGGYIYSRSILAIISTVVHWVAFEIIGSPFPLALALWVGFFSQFIPVIGTYIAGALPVLIGLLDDPVQGIWMLIVIVIYQQIENYLLAPPITAHTMEIHVAVAFGAVVAGTSLLGITGALLALPAAATFQAFISTYLQRHDVVDSELLPNEGSKRSRRKRE
jgi:predicted PurR-regulated permease PerM